MTVLHHGSLRLTSSIQYIVTEEASVRDSACKSTDIVAQCLPQYTFQGEYAEMLIRLSTKEWFTARCSAALLLSTAYPKLSSQQQSQLLANFAKLCRDDTPMVRRVAAQNLGKMVQNVVNVLGRSSLNQTGKVTTLLLPLYEELASNDQPVSERSDIIGNDAVSTDYIMRHNRIQLGCIPQTIVSSLVRL
jgi:serine/threonine-protein phosphatase 2A regulatory subunit A